MTQNKQSLVSRLKSAGWAEIVPDWEYRKGTWGAWRDTSSWWMIGTDDNPRVYDVPERQVSDSQWTVGLIEHLCRMEDERSRLRAALARISEMDGMLGCREYTAEVLNQCYHTWLVREPNSHYCPICSQTKTAP